MQLLMDAFGPAASFLGCDDAHALKATCRWIACLAEILVRTTQEAYRICFESRKLAIHDKDAKEYAESEHSSDSDEWYWYEHDRSDPWSDHW